MLRSYFKHPEGDIKDKENWIAVDKIVKNSDPEEKNILDELFGSCKKDIKQYISKKDSVDKDEFWKWLNEISKEIAKERGLI